MAAMTRKVHMAAVQPLTAGPATSQDRMVQSGLTLLRAAVESGADIVCLPEYFNVMGLAEEAWRQPPPVEDSSIWCEVADLASTFGAYVILPVLEQRESALYNTALIVDRAGRLAGRYDKTHLTANERRKCGITPGVDYPVFGLDFGNVGIMTCYDGHFPEVSRILALQGAEVLFFPSLQRHLTASLLEAQLRTRAVDNCVYLVRASYGYADEEAWVPGMMVGKSCIVDFEGTILVDAGPRSGVCAHVIDLDRPRTKERSYAGEVGDAAAFMLQDRRPTTYGKLTIP